MTITISSLIAKQDYISFIRQQLITPDLEKHVEKQVIISLIAGMSIAALVLSMIQSHFGYSGLVPILTMAFMLVVILVFFRKKLVKSQLEYNLQKVIKGFTEKLNKDQSGWQDLQRTLVLTDEDISVTDKYSSMRLPWNKITSVEISENWLVLKKDHSNQVIVMKNGLSGIGWDEFVKILEEKARAGKAG